MAMYTNWGENSSEFSCRFVGNAGNVCNAPCLRDPEADIVREPLCYEHASGPEKQRRDMASGKATM